MLKKLLTYFLATRPQFFTAVIIPALLGTAIAYKDIGHISEIYLTITVVALLLCHGSINILNDYYDHKNGTDVINEERLSPFTGGSRVIQDGKLNPSEMFRFGSILAALAIGLGLYLAYEIGYVIIILGLIGISTGILYSSPFVFLASRGLGEFFVWLNFGVLTTVGSYYVQTGTFSIDVFVASLPIAFLITAVLFINEFPDYSADKKCGKTNLIVRLGKKRARLGVPILIVSAFISLLIGIKYGYLPTGSLIALIGSITGEYAIFRTLRYYDSPKLLPAIKATIVTHMLTGVLLIASYFIQF